MNDYIKASVIAYKIFCMTDGKILVNQEEILKKCTDFELNFYCKIMIRGKTGMPEFHDISDSKLSELFEESFEKLKILSV